MGFFFKGLKKEIETAVEDEPSLFEPLKVNSSKKVSSQILSSASWMASFDVDMDGLYDYHARMVWAIVYSDTNSYILTKLLYIDIEESPGCINDYLQILASSFRISFCGVGFQEVFAILSDRAYILFKSDHALNRFGFNITFQEITGAMKHETQCGDVLTSPSDYLTSIDMNGDGQYDSGQDCEVTIKVGYRKVIVFEVIKQNIYQYERSSKCEGDFLQVYEDHRSIGIYCGKTKPPNFTTEANILYVRFKADELRSGEGFEAIYFQAQDVKDCSADYKCLLADRTIQQDYLCDTYSDCPNGDDERFCDFRCPSGCLCIGLSVDCTGRDDCRFNRKSASFLNQTVVLSLSTRSLDISSNHDMFLYLSLEKQNLVFLTRLNLSSCGITDLPIDIFLSMKNLKVLDLSFNKIRHLKAKLFLNQAQLEMFLFRSNSESLIIESEAFVGLVSLQYLDLNTLQIERISKGSFATLHLKALTIYHSHISEIDSVSFYELEAEGIYLNSSTIDTFTETMFHGGTGIRQFVTDEFKYCCVRPLSVQEEDCYPQKDEFSSCDDLIKINFLRLLVLVVGLFALVSNVSSVIYRFRYHAGQLKFCYGIAVLNLAGSDSLFGLYLILIGITDNIYRGVYIFHEEAWRSSTWCQFAGVLSTVSCEASVLFSYLITVDRFLVIKYPFGQKRLTHKNGTAIAVVIWSSALFVAVLPFTLPSYFKGEFYSRSGLCLALPLTRGRPSVWGYAFGIFIVFNSVACLLLAIGQWKIFKEIKTSKKAVGDRRSKSTIDSRIARNLFLVVTTNLLCWLPVEFIGVLALADYPIPVNVYSWIAVVVLPINSAVNPVLYTLSEMLQKKKKVTHDTESMVMKYMLTAGDVTETDDLDGCTDLWKSSEFWSFKGQSPDFTPLTETLREEWFCSKQRLYVAIDICKLLHKLHDRKVSQEDLTIDDIFVKKSSQERCKVVLLCRPKQMLKLSDQDDNILALGSVISTLMRRA